MRTIWFCLIISLVILSDVRSGKACETCGCSASSQFGGILPLYNNHNFSLRYSWRSFSTNNTDNNARAEDVFQSIDLIYRHVYKEKWFFGVQLPLQFLGRTLSGQRQLVQGIGDISLRADRFLIDFNNTEKKRRISLLANIQIKTPSGAFQQTDQNGNIIPGLQLGTGSWDLISGLQMVYKKDNLGFDMQINYAYKGENPVAFRFGDQLTAQMKAFALIKKPSFAFMPFAGVSYEFAQLDHERGYQVLQSGGQVCWFSPGIEWYRGKFSLNISAQLPIQQSLAQGNIEQHTRLSVRTNFWLR